MRTYTYIGVDVSKAMLDVNLQGKYMQFDNNKEGIEKLFNNDKELAIEIQDCLLVMEASGGYERQLVESCEQKTINYHVAHANKVRSYAKSKGLKAKTDQLDCGLLTDFGQVMRIQPDINLLSENANEIKRLLKRREELKSDKQREKNRLDTITSPGIRDSIESHIKWLDDEIKRLDKQLKDEQCKESVKENHVLLTSVPGIGDLTANYLLALLPELGSVGHKVISALVGVAPYNRDSGNFEGKRFIQGGRCKLRHALYMSALTATRCNEPLRNFYQRLRTAGKPAKVAIIAVMRKLLSMINSVMTRQTPWKDDLNATNR